jgi:hypothetical protein
MRSMTLALILAPTLLSSAVAAAQSTTGTITGRVSDPQGLTAPGVTVTASSPNLQGTRFTVTSVSGDYLLTLLPPGAYTLTFDLSGFARVEKRVSLSPTQVLPVDATLGTATVDEVVLVTGRSVDVLMRTAQVATNFDQTLIASLPTNRDINAALQLAPAVHATGPGGAYSIAGAMSFQNLFMVNGVAVSDNLRGQPYDLYIEDAVQQTTIATAGISAEHGRFGGGVVNVVTKSGGNAFSGSFRNTVLNDKWRTLSPFEETSIAADPDHKDTRVDVTVPTYEYTLGGPVLRDRLWFFAAGRNQRQESGRTLVTTNIPYTFESRQRRYEAKATYAAHPNHRVQGSFIDSHDEQINTSQNPATAMDVRSLYNAKRPMNLFALEYTAILSEAFFLEARYSARNETLSDIGARDRDLVNGTLLVDRANRRYWAPTFCGVCGSEERDGQDLFVKGSYFLSTTAAGSHTMTFGYDGYNDKRYSNNHQSGSDYRITGTTAIMQGTNLTAQFMADGNTLITWQPIFVTSEGTNFRTHSGFYTDHWRMSDRVSANLGLRYDRNDAVDSSGQLVTKGAAWSPRLGVVLDPRGDQKWSVTGSVGKYVDALANVVVNAASPAGNPDGYQFAYRGPDINKDPTGSLTSTADGIRQVFDWFFANGGANLPVVGVPSVTGVSTAISPTLRSPSVWEYAGGISRQVGSRAAVRADVTYRDYGNFYALRTDTTTGRATDTREQAPAAVRGRSYDLSIIENTERLTREYAGVTLQGQYRFGPEIEAGGTYTLSRAWGNVDGETQSGPAPSAALQYPEYKQAAWNYPDGDLAIDQRHRARLWINYGLPWVSGLTVSALQILESGVPYNAFSGSGVNPAPFVTNPGYLSVPSTTTQYYFTARDAFRTEGQRRTDFAISYAYRMKALRNVQLFGQVQVLNALNDFQLCACGAATAFQDGGFINAMRIDQTVRTPVNAPAVYQAFNPFTEAPVEGVNWARGPNFGKALNRQAYTTPRTLRLTFGVRF